MINITQIMTQEQILEIAHKSTAIPSLWIAWFCFIIIQLIVGYGFTSKYTKWGRFFWMWGLTSLISMGVIIFLSYSPNTIQLIVEIWNNLWGLTP